ncbi:MAG: hypothetical protein C4326_06710 [Ignavibacteria bacterium]
MKRTRFLLMLLLFCFASLSAKNAYKQGDMVGHLGLGIGGLGGFYGSSSLPVIAVGLDFGIEKYISVGGIVGYTSSSQEFNYFIINAPSVYKWKYTYITIGARGSYHFYQIDNEKLDVYGGAGLGYNIVSASFQGDATRRTAVGGASGSYLFFGIHAGARYYFSPAFAAFAELGYGIGILNIGISMKL